MPETAAPVTSSLAQMPLRTAEFLVVDTETNGLAGDRCEVIEVGAVLVGGDTLPVRKPDPLPLLHAAQLLGMHAVQLYTEVKNIFISLE